MELIRGDYKTYRFQRKRKTEEGYELIKDKPDNVYFTVKDNFYTKELLFQKKLSDNTIIFNEYNYSYSFEINPKDTNDLYYGDYKYDIEVIENGKPKTIAKGNLKITEEVTFAENEG